MRSGLVSDLVTEYERNESKKADDAFVIDLVFFSFFIYSLYFVLIGN